MNLFLLNTNKTTKKKKAVKKYYSLFELQKRIWRITKTALCGMLTVAG